MTRTLRTLLAVALAALPVLAVVATPEVAWAQVEDDLREGDRFFEEKNWKKAAAAYDAAIRKYPSQVPPAAYSKRASIYLAEGNLEGGLAFIRDKAKQAHPDAPELLETEAAILWQLGKKGDAVPIAERAVAAKPSAFAAQYILGEYYYGAKEASKTAAAYEAYLKHRPKEQEANDVFPLIRLGYAQLALGKYDEARGQFETLQRRHGKRPHAATNARLGMCAVYAGLGKYDQAITICEQIDRKIRERDTTGSVYYNLARAYLEKKQYAKARAEATEYTRIRKGAAKGYILQGDTFYEQGDYERALERYREAEQRVKSNESDLESRLAVKMGIAYTKLRRPDYRAAIDRLEAGRKRDPRNVEIVAALGGAYLATRDDKKVIDVTEPLVRDKEFEKRSASERRDLLLLSGKAHYNQGKVSEARARFEAAYKADANEITVQTALADTIQFQAYQAFAKNEFKAAEGLLDDAAKVKPNDIGVAINRAVVDIKQGQCESAQKQLERLKGRAGGDEALYHRLVARTYLCVSKPNPKKAAEHYAEADKAVKRVSNNLLQAEIYTEWAPILMKQGHDLNDVVSKLQDALQFTAGTQAPKTHDAAKRNLAVALFRRGWKHLKDGRSSEAVADFERAAREPSLLKGSEPLAFEFSHALALLDKGDTGEAAKLFKSLASKGKQSSYLKAPYDKVGTAFFAAYANYRSGNASLRETAAKEFDKLSGSASGSFAAKIRELQASSWEYVAYDAWRSGKTSAAGKALTSAARTASGDLERRIRNNRAVLDLGSKQIAVLEGLGGAPPESLVNLGVLYDQAGKPKEAYEAWQKARAKGASARDLAKWIDAKKRIYGFN